MATTHSKMAAVAAAVEQVVVGHLLILLVMVADHVKVVLVVKQEMDITIYLILRMLVF
tara:strand:- start:500 stop:673 length:174 start_codon:yes stop_codon:yes gene_type:complete